MKFFRGYLLSFTILGIFTIGANAQSGYFGTYFTQTASAANVASDGGTLLNNLALNGDSAKICIFSPVFGAATPYDFYNAVNFGLQYYSPQWGIYQENDDSVPFDSQFNVLVPTLNGISLIHTADSTNIDSNYTVIDDSAINNNPNALLFFSHNYNPYNDTDGTDCDQTLGVFYDSAIGKWTLYNDDSTGSFIANTQFNIFAVNPCPNAFLQVADSASTTYYYIMYIDNPFLNGNPNATLFVTYNLNAAGYDIFNQSPIETWYDETENQWAIYNVNKNAINIGSAFNVLIADNIPTGIANQPDNYNLNLYPNPASSFSYLKYELKETAQVKIDLMNSEGQEIVHIFNGQQNQGIHSVQVQLSSLATGVYFCKFSADGVVSVKPIVRQ